LICKNCVKAGDLIKSLRVLKSDDVLNTSMVKGQIKLHHASCKGETWCDCQHFPELNKIGDTGDAQKYIEECLLPTTS